MGYAASEPSNGLHLLCLAKLFFQPFPFRVIGNDFHDSYHRAARISKGSRPKTDVYRVAVLAAPSLLGPDLRLTAQQIRESLSESGNLVREDDGERGSDSFFLGEA